MSRWFPALLLSLAWVVPAPAAGLLIPSDQAVAPLAMLEHHVSVKITEQVAVTRVEQTFRNPTSRDLEATYVFPVPKGASVDKFSMWVDGKEVKGELVEAGKAREIYTDVVRRMQDPGLLEYAGNNVLKLRVYPVPANGNQKVAVRFTSINEQDAGLVTYTYPLRTEGKASQTERDFKLDVSIESKQAVQNVYSPTHAVTVTPKGDSHARVHFEKKQGELDRDFQLYYTLGKGDVGLTGLTHRASGQPGHVLFLISPRADLGSTREVPRDFVFVMDTSGSMAGVKMEQARKALLYCIDRLGANDRFAVLNFATVVSHFRDGLSPANSATRDQAKQWVRELSSTGGTAIDPALQAALALRPRDESRPFTVVFFTDGEPTVGEANPERILKNVTDRNSSHTRIFTFGVGDDVNATLLDRVAEATRAVSTYVRPEEDIEAKVSGLYAKISHPVMTDLRLSVGAGVRLTETYPSKLPDLFHGGQIVVLARYTGHGAATVDLTGKVGGETKTVTYELRFPEKTGDQLAFVEPLWARRKVGYLLDEIRRNGEKAELKDEVITLARKHGITTPYTSYLVVPDTVAPPARQPLAASTPRPMTRSANPVRTPMKQLLGAPAAAAAPGGTPLESFQAGNQYNITQTAPNTTGGLAGDAFGRRPTTTGGQNAITYSSTTVTPSGVINNSTDTYRQHGYAVNGSLPPSPTMPTPVAGTAPPANQPAAEQFYASGPRLSDNGRLQEALQNGQANSGKLGVDLAVTLDDLRNNAQVGQAKSCQAAGRTCREVNGVWVDEGYDAKMKTVRVKALSKAYFRLLEKHAELGEVLKLGTRLVWVTPSGTALVIDPSEGKESLKDEQIEALFRKS